MQKEPATRPDAIAFSIWNRKPCPTRYEQHLSEGLPSLRDVFNCVQYEAHYLFGQMTSVLAFDLGDTLVEYAGLPLSWEAHYPDALAHLASVVEVRPTPRMMASAFSILRRYNTRLAPRVTEVSFSQILRELLVCWEVSAASNEFCLCRKHSSPCFGNGYGVFRRLVPCCARRVRVGSESEYSPMCRTGCRENWSLRMWRRQEFANGWMCWMTSCDAGHRKPSPATLETVAAAFHCDPEQMLYVGNERKDIEAALAFGCEAVLLNRVGARPDWGQHRTISTLTEL